MRQHPAAAVRVLPGFPRDLRSGDDDSHMLGLPLRSIHANLGDEAAFSSGGGSIISWRPPKTRGIFLTEKTVTFLTYLVAVLISLAQSDGGDADYHAPRNWLLNPSTHLPSVVFRGTPGYEFRRAASMRNASRASFVGFREVNRIEIVQHYAPSFIYQELLRLQVEVNAADDFVQRLHKYIPGDGQK